ncbi:MAG TPA: hypothetical protein VKY59_05350 [Spirillospora sp.]|nr:hypothetical protein [Spirillospora sp.]
MIGEGPPEVQLFLLQPFQCCFQCGFLLPASAGVASHVRQVRLANLRQHLWCHLDVAQKLRNLLIDQGAGEIEMAAGDAVVGHPVGGATAVGGRAGELDQPAIRLFEIDQALQQIEVLLLRGGLVVAFRQDRQPQLKFLGGYHWLPGATNSLRRDICPVIVHHHPPGIKPVVKRLGQRGLPGSGFATRIQMHKRHAASQPVTASSQRLADVFQRGRILQQQVPGVAPDFCLLRVDFDPALVTGMVVLLFRTEFSEPNLFVEIPIRCPPRPFPLE